MNPERFARLRELLLTLPRLPQAERKNYLDAVCADDPELRREAESLLEWDPETGVPAVARTGGAPGLLDLPPASDLAGPALPERIGRYRVLGLLGQGGMGVVYRAQQTEPIQREVALKIVRRGLDSQRVLARFESERQTLALMDHPHIARVLDAGSDDDGNPYFVMELVRGMSVTNYARQHSLTIRQRLGLLATSCRAAHHAHTKGIVHRDLKPSNILVTTHDDLPIPKIIDFGIAKATDVELSGPTLTQEGRLVGTLEYMSPEQARGIPGGVDTRSDVYSLGVILYELLTDSLPYEVRDLPLPDAVQVIETQTPRAMRQTSTGERRLDHDIETIVKKALEKEPDRRYGSAAEFANDIDRFLRCEPILARPPSTIYQLRKLATRHVGAFAFAALLLVSLIVFVVILSFQLQAQRQERARAEMEARKATQISEFIEEMLTSVNPAVKNVDVRVRDLLDDAARQVDFGLIDDPETEAALRRTLGNTYLTLGLYAKAQDQLRHALDLRRRIHGQDHLFVAQSLEDLASFHLAGAVDRDDIAAADTLCREALAIRSTALGENHLDTASSLHQLAKIHQHRNELSGAESLYVRALDIRERSLGPNDPEIVTSLLSLAPVLSNQNRPDEGRAFIRRAVEISRGLHDEDHPDLAAALRALSGIAGGQEGESLAVEVVAMERRMWGDRHPRVAEALAHLGGVYTDQNRFEEAETLYRESLDIYVAFHGEGSTPAARGHSNLGHFLWMKGDFAGSEEELREAISIWREKAPDTWYLGMGLNNLAVTLANLRKDEEAAELYSESLEIFEKVWGPEHFHVAMSYNNFAAFLLERGRFQEAEPHLRRAIAGWTETLGEKHSNIATATSNLALALYGMDRIEEAETLYRQALEIHEETAILVSWTTGHLVASMNLGRCLHQLGRLTEAQDVLEKTERNMRESEMAGHPLHDQALIHLGSLYVDLRRYRDGEEVLLQSVASLEENSPPDRSLLSYARIALATCLAAQGRNDEADSLFALSSPDAWTRIEVLPCERRLARERALHYYESIGRTDRAAQIRDIQP